MRLSFSLKCLVVGGVLPLAATAACGKGSTSNSGGGGGISQTPPQSAAALQPWLAKGYYKSWACQAAPHPAGGSSPHSTNRICSNDILAGASAPPWPDGAAAVKELYPAAGASAPYGYAVYVKTETDSMGGANWYWYEDNPSLGGVVADGLGTSGNPLTVCVDCHGGSGADGGAGAGDFVWTQVKSGG